MESSFDICSYLLKVPLLSATFPPHNAVSPRFLVTTQRPGPFPSSLSFWLLTVTVYIGNKTSPQLLSMIERSYIIFRGRQAIQIALEE